MADRVLSELVGQRGRLILVIDDRHEPTSHELTSPDALAQLTRLLTNLPGDVPAAPATVAISRCACISCAWQRASRGPRSSRSARNLSAGSHPRPRDM